jgi:hypothetical protein
MEMIGVAEDDLGAKFAEFARIDSFDAPLRADGHEHGGVDEAVGGGEAAAASFGGGVGLEEIKHGKTLTADRHG